MTCCHGFGACKVDLTTDGNFWQKSWCGHQCTTDAASQAWTMMGCCISSPACRSCCTWTCPAATVSRDGTRHEKRQSAAQRSAVCSQGTGSQTLCCGRGARSSSIWATKVMMWTRFSADTGACFGSAVVQSCGQAVQLGKWLWHTVSIIVAAAVRPAMQKLNEELG